MEKQYFTVQSFMDAVISEAKADPRYEEAMRICELDYEVIPFGHSDHQLRQCSFDVVSQVTYGGSEGIYGDILLHGVWQKGHSFRQFAIYTLKTLRTDRETYLAMGAIANLICYHAMEIVSKNLNRFD